MYHTASIVTTTEPPTSADSASQEATPDTVPLRLAFDTPDCSEVLGWFIETWYASMGSDEQRALIVPYISRLAGTHSTVGVERQRAKMALLWLTGVYAATWLDAAGLTDHAATLRTTKRVNRRKLRTAATAAREAADSFREGLGSSTGVAYSEAWSAVETSAGAAANKVVCDAVTVLGNSGVLGRRLYDGATLNSARLGAWEAAVQSAIKIAFEASWGGSPDEDWATLNINNIRDTLKPTIEMLQTSALQLFDDMINVADDETEPFNVTQQ